MRRRDDDSGAGFRIRSRVVVNQSDAKPPAHRRQIVRLQPPAPPGKLDCADERRFRHAELGCRTAHCQNTAVERSVVRCEERRAFEQGDKSRPDFGEGRRGGYHFPGNPVNVGEDDVLAGRPN